jgi:hypothetical protein
MSTGVPGEAGLAAGIPAQFRPFWGGVAEYEIRLPYCCSCQQFHWYPQAYCPNCGSADLGWRRVRPSGQVFASTVVRRALVPGAGPRAPFGIALVSLDDAPHCRLVLNTEGSDQVPIGSPVDIVFVADQSGRTVPRAVAAQRDDRGR